MLKFLLWVVILSLMSISVTVYNEQNIIDNKIVLEKYEQPPKSLDSNDVECLARNLYHEARGEPIEGILLVGKVTLNRLHSGKFADSICGVVYQKHQFSWTIRDRPVPKLYSDYYRTLSAAILSNQYEIGKRFQGILYYHANYVKPQWSEKVAFVGQVGNHLFYKEK